MNQLVDTVQIYFRKDEQYLMLFRNKKKNDMSEGKWMGVGGKVEKDESIDEAAIRESKEETGLDIVSLKYAGEVLFVNDDYQEMMYIYEVTDFSGELIPCNEGELRWIPIKDIYSLPMWEGDKAFLPLLINHQPYFKLKVFYKNKELVRIETVREA